MMLSMNQMTVPSWGLDDFLARCDQTGIRSVGLWRERVQDHGLERTVAQLHSLRLDVSTLCRAGFFTASDADPSIVELDNRRAVDEAAALGASALVLLGGGLPTGSRNLTAARTLVERGIEQLLPYAERRDVRLALEPLHPALCADRSVISTLDQALDVVDRLPSAHLGVVVDAFHVWWDPQLWDAIERAGPRIFSVQVSDHPVVLRDPLHGRLLPGAGVIDLPRLLGAVAAAGYREAVEVEVFSTEQWARAPDRVLADAIDQTQPLLQEAS
jgi:sugar phosphate isomerase/epimerase